MKTSIQKQNEYFFMKENAGKLFNYNTPIEEVLSKIDIPIRYKSDVIILFEDHQIRLDILYVEYNVRVSLVYDRKVYDSFEYITFKCNKTGYECQFNVIDNFYHTLPFLKSFFTICDKKQVSIKLFS